MDSNLRSVLRLPESRGAASWGHPRPVGAGGAGGGGRVGPLPEAQIRLGRHDVGRGSGSGVGTPEETLVRVLHDALRVQGQGGGRGRFRGLWWRQGRGRRPLLCASLRRCRIHSSVSAQSPRNTRANKRSRPTRLQTLQREYLKKHAKTTITNFDYGWRHDTIVTNDRFWKSDVVSESLQM